jgi:hypothetical protein
MKISAFDGSIMFQHLSIRRDMDRDGFLATELGKEAKRELINEIWWHHNIKPEPGISANVLYRGDTLDKVFILMDIPQDASGEWTLDIELARKAAHDEWLRRELGTPPYHYAWGDIVSHVDYKGVVSEIIVVYAADQGQGRTRR